MQSQRFRGKAAALSLRSLVQRWAHVVGEAGVQYMASGWGLTLPVLPFSHYVWLLIVPAWGLS